MIRPIDSDSLRERKKQRTREAIADAGLELFLARGFDNVTVAEVAEAAEVSEKTVFNHFSCKEELFFDQGPSIGNQLVALVRGRARGVSVVEALHAFGHVGIGGAAPAAADDDDDGALRTEWERHMRAHGHMRGGPHARHIEERWNERTRRQAEHLRKHRAQHARFREALREKLDMLDGAGPLGEAPRRVLRKILDETEVELGVHDRAPTPGADDAAGGELGVDMERFRQVIRESPALTAYLDRMFATYEKSLRDALLEETKEDDVRARIEAHVLAAGVVAALRYQLEAGDLGPPAGQRLFARGLRALERGFADWLPKKAR